MIKMLTTLGITSVISKRRKKENGGREHRDIKKRQTTRNQTRQRARLPTDPSERKAYELPDFVSDHKPFKALLLQMLKSSANAQQRLRLIEAAVADHYLIPTECGIVAPTLAHIQNYRKAAAAEPGLHGRGAPGPQVAFCMCSHLVKMDIGQNPKEEIRTKILDKLASYKLEDTTCIASTCILKPCHDSDFHKLIFISPDGEVRSALRRGLTALSGIKHFSGPAPASGQEDELQKWIETLEL